MLKKQFAEFKSIFISDDLLKENEQHANIVTASTMLNVFWLNVIAWILVYFNVFKLGLKIMNTVMVSSIILLVLPAIICYVKGGNGKWIKHLLFTCFALMLAIADAILKYNVTLVMVLPIVLAARYYNKKFTISVAMLTTITFIISAYMSIHIGQQDLNSYNLIIPSGTTITIDKTLRDAISTLQIDELDRLNKILLHLIIPKILLFNIIAFACIQISQSGRKMVKKQQEITKAGERISTELNLANAIQKSMLPSVFPPFANHDEIDIYAYMVPAKEVGGDFYDMFLLDDNHLAICIADVTGKGVPAALVMMISKTLIKNISKIDMDVSKTFFRVNNMLCDGNKTDVFVTSWLGIVDLRNGKMEYVNAGHNPPLLFSKEKGKFSYLTEKPNLVLAGMENTNYNKVKIQIEPGDRLFLYTDGIVEATNVNNELYGEERLINFLNSHIDLNANETILGVKNDVDNFVKEAEQFDDITMLELVYKKRRIESSFVKKEFKADKNELSKVQDFVVKELQKYHCNKETVAKINLVAEEIFINIANYAYDDIIGTCSLTIQRDRRNEFTFIFEDSGTPFNPLKKQDPNIKLSAAERDIGGLGIFITKKTMDDVKYRYENDKNVLIIKQFIKEEDNNEY